MHNGTQKGTQKGTEGGAEKRRSLPEFSCPTVDNVYVDARAAAQPFSQERRESCRSGAGHGRLRAHGLDLAFPTTLLLLTLSGRDTGKASSRSENVVRRLRQRGPSAARCL